MAANRWALWGEPLLEEPSIRVRRGAVVDGVERVGQPVDLRSRFPLRPSLATSERGLTYLLYMSNSDMILPVN